MKSKTWKVISSISILGLLIFGVTFIMGVTPTKPSRVSEGEGKNNEEILGRFVLRGVRWVSHEGNHKLFSIQADKIIHRSYTRHFFTFHNLKEIYASNLKLESYPKRQCSSQEVYSFLDSVMETMGKELISLVSVPRDIDELSDINSEILIRMVIENLAAVMRLQSGAKVILSADRAIIYLGGHKVAFQGNFSLTSADGEYLNAPEAMWLRDWKGIYFPKGYQITAKRGNQEGGPNFLVIDEAGRLVASSRYPTIEPKPTDFENIEKTIDALVSKALLRLFPWLPTNLIRPVKQGCQEKKTIKSHI